MKQKIMSSLLLLLSFSLLSSCETSYSIVITYPDNNQIMDIIESPVNDYITAMKKGSDNIEHPYSFYENLSSDVRVSDYASMITDYSKFNDITLSFYSNKNDEEHIISISENNNLIDSKIIKTKSNIVNIDNLFANKTYYYQVSNLDKTITSEIYSFSTPSDYRLLDAGDVINVRDLGGKMTKSGKRIKQGILYRGSEIVKQTYTDSGGTSHYASLTQKAKETFVNDMNIKYELDFRGDDEAYNIETSELGSSVEYKRVSLLEYENCLIEEQKPLYKEAMTKIFGASKDAPLYYHCHAGADRTGTISFLIEGLLGVSCIDLMIDYELTSFSRNPRIRDDDKKTYMRFPQLLRGFMSSSYNSDPSDDISTCIYNYFVDGLGFNNQEVDSFINMMLENN
jgi:protein tyrosine/serine phosphatase